MLSKLIFDACVMPSHMPEKMMMEHAMLIAILHANIGNEVGKIFLLIRLCNTTSMYAYFVNDLTVL